MDPIKGQLGGTPTWEECASLMEALPGLPPEGRTGALLRLLRSPGPGMRQQAVRMAAAMLPAESAVALLRDEADDALRSVGVEILKRKGMEAFPAACDLLRDEDSGVVLQAIEILDALKVPGALEPLRPLLSHLDPNVVQAALGAIGRTRDARAVNDLLPFLGEDPWFRIASAQALGNLRCRSAVGPLTRLLQDPMTGPIAAEALAQIGGTVAFRALAEYYLASRSELEPESVLGLLAHVSQGLPSRPKPFPGLRETVIPVLNDASDHNRLAAAHCLLSLGEGPGDGWALDVLEVLSANSADLPRCLLKRADLVPTLLHSGPLGSVWGIRLASLHPRSFAAEDLEAALAGPGAAEAASHVSELFERLRAPSMTGLLLKFYLALPAEVRPSLGDALAAHAREIRRRIASGQVPEGPARAVLEILLGANPKKGAGAILGLAPGDRLEALSQLTGNADLVEALPWAAWLAESPDLYLRLACDAAVHSGSRALLSILRNILEQSPVLEVIRTVGETADSASIPLLLRHLAGGDALTRVTIIESLGQIGGPEVLSSLRALARECSPEEVRHVFRALSRAAEEEDAPLFRRAASHPDWVVRLASADVLGRFPGAENLSILATLSSDPASVVAHRARALMES
jgi:HEAT repeat protein